MRRALQRRFGAGSQRYAYFALFLISCAVHAQTASIAPGEYIAGAGGGTLIVAPAVGDGQTFSIESFGINGHECSLAGVIRKLRAEVETDKGEAACVVEFALNGAAIEVKPKTEQACRYFCGMRAWFEDSYVRAPPGCTGQEVKQARAGFKTAYDGKDYARARTYLAPLLAQCTEVLSEFADGDIRNDLAVTLYHLGKLAECREVLDKIGYLVETSDAELREQYSYAPSDADGYIAIARAARTNFRLCSGDRKK